MYDLICLSRNPYVVIDLTGLGDMLTKEAMDALAAAKASTMLERERKLADEKVMEQEKEERSRKWRKRFALGALARCGTGDLPIPEQIEEIWSGLSGGNLNIINDETNYYDQIVMIYTVDENDDPVDLIYTSGIIKVGALITITVLESEVA